MDLRPDKPDCGQSLGEAERKAALALVRRSVEAAVRGNRCPEAIEGHPGLDAHRATFVTLSRRGKLRGCIGIVEPKATLRESLVHCAIAAATEDPRFPPVTPEELPEIHYEISILSPLQPVASSAEVEVGRHGVLIEMGPQRGLLLPQVAGEHAWDRETFLDHVCLKAGLPPGTWRRGARISVFTAEVFGDGPRAEIGP